MRKSGLLCVVGVLFMILGGTAQAALISGSIAFGSFNPPALVGGTDLSNNTGFDFVEGPSAIVNLGATGDFAGFPFPTLARFYDFSFDPFSGTPVLWTTPEPFPVFGLQMTGLSIGPRNANSLVLSGGGLIFSSIFGFDPTPGHWTFTANNDGQSLSFSSSAVPEPGTILLLGTGLIGLIGWGRKKIRT